MKVSRHHLLLVLILLGGAALRFWHLDSKPVWADEVLTALFSLGRSFDDVPLDRVVPVSELEHIFTLNPATSCSQIVQTVSTQSVHPPLFFCWMHSWMAWIQGLDQSWVWKLRAMPALVGVVAIAALYQLNRVAFSPAAGLLGAALMAVSPFAVYLSQEARHYTLPMLLITLALLGLYQLHRDLYHQRFRPPIWLGWVLVNSLGFYVHYFFLLAFFAQAATLIINFLSLKYLPTLHPLPSNLHLRRSLGVITLAIIGTSLTYLPWLPTLVNHLTRPETDWLNTPQSNWLDAIAPLYQLPLGWIVMVIALPAESESIWIAAISVGGMLLFTGWFGWKVFPKFWQLWSARETHLATRMLVVFTLLVLLEFLVIVYLLNKDITQVPRYNFIYFPAVCALLGASLSQTTVGTQILEAAIGDFISASRPVQRRLKAERKGTKVVAWLLLVGMLSSALVVSNQGFQKPYQPDRVAQNMLVESAKPLLVSLAYMDFQDIALGLSFGLALNHEAWNQATHPNETYFAFLARSQGYERIWQTLPELNHPLLFPLNFWLVAPGLRRVDYPSQLSLATNQPGTQATCKLDPGNYHRLGVPYQMYRCIAVLNQP
ncbi:glycosyltransferase family 39 protein [Leptothermofonsia sp. ETS-13]|uniref:glycosyltransferase family 39 protein n=1 Tax=Leptothermofonsia sp. ETS-13 TaxID=3035696 RepID=UPI003B9F39CC